MAANEHGVPDAIGPDSIKHFVGKWQAREPEMRVAQVFCPPARLPRFLAWGGLLHELREALFELSDARVTGVKCGWWAEELIGLDGGRHRHPLTEALAGSSAPWRELGRAVLAQAGDDARQADTAEAIAALLPLAQAAVAVEGALFDRQAGDAAARALAVHWLWHRLPEGLASEDRARLPMHLFARHAVTAEALAAGEGMPLLRDWATELAAALPPLTGGPLPAQFRQRFDAARLARLADGKGFTPPPDLGTLWRAWRAARDS